MSILQIIIALSISNFFLLYSMKDADSLKNICVNYFVEKLIKEEKDNKEIIPQVHRLPVELQEFISKQLYSRIPPECNRVNLNASSQIYWK